MEKETYKTAIELLQRYEPTHPSLQHNSTPSQSRHNHDRTPEVRKRVVSHPAMMHQSATPTAPVTPRPPVSQHVPPIATPVPNSAQRSAPPPATPKEEHHSSDSQPFIPPGEPYTFPVQLIPCDPFRHVFRGSPWSSHPLSNIAKKPVQGGQGTTTLGVDVGWCVLLY